MDTKGPVDLSTKKVIADTFFASTSKIFVAFLKPFRGFILGRLLGTAAYGLLNVAVPYVNILTILSNIGFNTALLKKMPEYMQRGRPELARMIYRAAAILTLLLGFTWGILLIALSGRISPDPAAVPAIRLFAFVIPFLALNALYALAYLAMQRGKLKAVATLVHGLLNTALPIAAVLVRRDVMLIIGAILTAEFLGAICFAAIFHRKILPRLGAASGPFVRGVREIFGFGFLFFFASLSWNLINAVDRLMVQHMLDISLFGSYVMATNIITMLSYVASSAGVALVPSLTAARESGDMERFRAQIGNTVRIVFLVMAPLVALAYVTAGDLFGLFLPGFGASVPVIRILAFIGLADILCRSGWAALAATGRGGFAATAYLFAALWNIVWNWILIPRYGLEGAAIATLSTFFILAIVLQIMTFVATRSRLAMRSLLHPALLALVFPLLERLLAGAGRVERIVLVTVGGTLLYIVLGSLTRLVSRIEITRAREALAGGNPTPFTRAGGAALRIIERIAR